MVIILISLLICAFWFFITMAIKGDGVHFHLVADDKSIEIWLLGWIAICGIAYLLIRSKRK
jgi:hypothetical protein